MTQQTSQAAPIPEPKGLLGKAKDKLLGRKTKEPEHWGILKKEAGFIPLYNQDDTEKRRGEMVKIMQDLNDLEFKIREAKDRAEIQKIEQSYNIQAYKLAKLFELYFTTGSPWVRGKDNADLSTCSSLFIQNFEEFGDIPEAFRDIHAEAMFMLHLSWQGIDVTNTPPYIIQVNNVPTNGQGVDMNRINFGEPPQP
jgi:hypothetical protein